MEFFMSQNFTDEQQLQILETKIQQAQAQNLPVDTYVLKQIEILQNSLDSFLEEMEENNALEDIQTAEIEIRQYAMMRKLAQKINAPTQKYDDLIKAVKTRIFGEENYENFFNTPHENQD